MKRPVVLLLAALLVGAAVAALLVLTSGGSGNQASSNPGQTSNAPAPRRASRSAQVNPASVTVAVLNGTATAGLAHKVATRLSSAGYKQGTIGNTADQTRTATVLSYLPGHKREALAVASTLKLGSASAQPIDQSTQAIACPPPSSCIATVVVTVGSDLATL